MPRIATLKNATTEQVVEGVDIDVFMEEMHRKGDEHLNAWELVPGTESGDGEPTPPAPEEVVLIPAFVAQPADNIPETDEQAAARIAAEKVAGTGPLMTASTAEQDVLTSADFNALTTTDLQSISTADVGTLTTTDLQSISTADVGTLSASDLKGGA